MTSNTGAEPRLVVLQLSFLLVYRRQKVCVTVNPDTKLTHNPPSVLFFDVTGMFQNTIQFCLRFCA